MTVSIATKINRGLRKDFTDWVLVGQDAWWFYLKGEYESGIALANISIEGNLKRIRIHSYANDEWLYMDNIIKDSFKARMVKNTLYIDADDKVEGHISISMPNPIDQTERYI